MKMSLVGLALLLILVGAVIAVNLNAPGYSTRTVCWPLAAQPEAN